jgi:hypothetical protein
MKRSSPLPLKLNLRFTDLRDAKHRSFGLYLVALLSHITHVTIKFCIGPRKHIVLA